MNLTSIDSHTVDLDLLPEAPAVLDVGARNFQFARLILETRPNARVYAMDPDRAIADPGIAGLSFLNMALVADEKTQSGYASYSTGEGNFLTDSPVWYADVYQVPCVNIQTLMRDLGVAHWDLVKLDCEGQEFPILEDWPGPIATQVSVEFHDHVTPGRRSAEYFRGLWKRLPDYRIVQHEPTQVGPAGVVGHWDSLLALNS